MNKFYSNKNFYYIKNNRKPFNSGKNKRESIFNKVYIKKSTAGEIKKPELLSSKSNSCYSVEKRKIEVESIKLKERSSIQMSLYMRETKVS